MPWFVYAGLFALQWIANQLIAARDYARQRPPTPQPFQNPTVGSGVKIPVVFGQMPVRPITTWFGGAKTVPVKQQQTFLLGFVTREQTVGYEYSVTMQGLLCWGMIDVINLIFADRYLMSEQNSITSYYNEDGRNIGNKLAWGGEVYVGGEPILHTLDLKTYKSGRATQTFALDNLYGGQGRGGGVKGTIELSIGSKQYGPSPIMQAAINRIHPPSLEPRNDVPAYNEFAYVVYKDLVMGETPTPPPIDWIVRRFPDKGFTDWIGGDDVDARTIEDASIYPWAQTDTNGAMILFEALQKREMGGPGALPWQIRADTFQNAQNTLRTEKLGMSLVLGGPNARLNTFQDLVDEVERTCDAHLIHDPESFAYRFKLNRNEAATPEQLAALPLYDARQIRKLSWNKGEIAETMNHVIVEFTDAARRYRSNFVEAHNDANIAQQGGQIKTQRIQYLSVTNYTTAQMLAERDLRKISTVLGKGSMKVTRALWSADRGDVIKITDEENELDALVCRVLGVDLGEPGDEEITVDLIEDVFGYDTTVRTIPTPPPVVIPIVKRPAVESVLLSENAGVGTLSLVLSDPEQRTIEIAFRNQVGGAPLSDWEVTDTATADDSDPTFPFNNHVATPALAGRHDYNVNLSYTAQSAIEYRIRYITYLDDSGDPIIEELTGRREFPTVIPPRILWAASIDGAGKVDVRIDGLQGDIGEFVMSVEGWLTVAGVDGAHVSFTVAVGRDDSGAIAPPWFLNDLAKLGGAGLDPGETATVHARVTVLRYRDAVHGDQTASYDDQLDLTRGAAKLLYPTWNVSSGSGPLPVGATRCWLTLPLGKITAWKVQADPAATIRFDLWVNTGGHDLPIDTDSLGLSFGPTAHQIEEGVFSTPIDIADNSNVLLAIVSNDNAAYATVTLTLEVPPV